MLGLTLDLGSHSQPGLAAAAKAAQELGIAHHVVDVHKAFHNQIVRPSLLAYNQGLTPNPCACCNASVKIPFLLNEARAHGCTGLATGHYARLLNSGSQLFLAEALDASKSQAYFLARLNPHLLPFLHFPLGDKTKQEVRAMALSLGLSAAASKDSQDCCFVPPEGFGALLQRYDKPRPGAIENSQGKVLGSHEGLHNFTVGQRRGLGLSAPRPLYVLRLRAERATVVVGHEEELWQSLVYGRQYLDYGQPMNNEPVSVRLRYARQGIMCKSITHKGGTVALELQTPSKGVAPGQLMVFNQGSMVTGSAFIYRPDDE